MAGAPPALSGFFGGVVASDGLELEAGFFGRESLEVGLGSLEEGVDEAPPEEVPGEDEEEDFFAAMAREAREEEERERRTLFQPREDRGMASAFVGGAEAAGYAAPSTQETAWRPPDAAALPAPSFDLRSVPLPPAPVPTQQQAQYPQAVPPPQYPQAVPPPPQYPQAVPPPQYAQAVPPPQYAQAMPPPQYPQAVPPPQYAQAMPPPPPQQHFHHHPPPPPMPQFFQQQPAMPPPQQQQQLTLEELEARMARATVVVPEPAPAPAPQQPAPPPPGWAQPPPGAQPKQSSLLDIQKEQQVQQRKEEMSRAAAAASAAAIPNNPAPMGQGGVNRHAVPQQAPPPRVMQRNHQQQQHAPPPRRRVKASRWMAEEELEQILRISWAATHTGTPYIEDYVVCALCEKYGKPYYINARAVPFHPETLRSSLPGTAVPKGEVAYVELEGLGKVPFSNIRAPKPLMDLTAAGNVGPAAGTQSLLTDPLVAVRKMIEDGFQLCQDVEDVDRMLRGANPTPETGEKLMRRRTLLIEGLIASMMLTDDPHPPPKPGNGTAVAFDRDVYFAKLTAVAKGTRLMAKCLSLAPRGAPACRKLVYAVLRHCRRLCAPPPPPAGTDASADTARRFGDLRAASGTLVAGVVAAVMAFDAEVVAACGCALAEGDLCAVPDPLPLPLEAGGQPGHTAPPGAGVLIAAVCARASQVGLPVGSAPSGALPPGAPAPSSSSASSWSSSYAAFSHLLSEHTSRGLSPSAPAELLRAAGLLAG